VSRFAELISVGLLALLLGCVISPLRSGGSGGGGTGGSGTIYVSNVSANTILRFAGASAASGNVVPNATISGSNTHLTTPQYLAVDSSKDRLFVANQGASSVLIFESASTKNGNVAPDRTISGSNTGLSAPVDVQLDIGRDLLYVADGAQVLVFGSASTVSGNTAPVRTINAGFSINAMLLDATGDRLFLANGSSNAIDVYDGASTLNNTVSPNRIISGSNTQLSTPAGLQIDNLGRLVVSNFGAPSIAIYANASTANGNLSPTASVNGSNTKLANPSQIAVASGQLFIADGTAASILFYSNLSSVTGNTAPNNVITGANTGIARTGGGSGPATAKGIALDSSR